MNFLIKELHAILSLLFTPAGLFFCLIAVFFKWRSWSKKEGHREGSGETYLSKEEQLVNAVGTLQNQGNDVSTIEETEKGFKLGLTQKDGSAKGYYVERYE